MSKQRTNPKFGYTESGVVRLDMLMHRIVLPYELIQEWDLSDKKTMYMDTVENGFLSLSPARLKPDNISVLLEKRTRILLPYKAISLLGFIKGYHELHLVSYTRDEALFKKRVKQCVFCGYTLDDIEEQGDKNTHILDYLGKSVCSNCIAGQKYCLSRERKYNGRISEE